MLSWLVFYRMSARRIYYNPKSLPDFSEHDRIPGAQRLLVPGELTNQIDSFASFPYARGWELGSNIVQRAASLVKSLGASVFFGMLRNPF